MVAQVGAAHVVGVPALVVTVESHGAEAVGGITPGAAATTPGHVPPRPDNARPVTDRRGVVHQVAHALPHFRAVERRLRRVTDFRERPGTGRAQVHAEAQFAQLGPRRRVEDRYAHVRGEVPGVLPGVRDGLVTDGPLPTVLPVPVAPGEEDTLRRPAGLMVVQAVAGGEDHAFADHPRAPDALA